MNKNRKKYFFSLIIAIITNPAFSLNYTKPYSWLSMEYVSWWPQNSPMSVPLITRNNNPNAFGIIGEAGTTIIFGSGSNRSSLDFDNIPGGRITLGSWLDNANRYGFEGSSFILSQSSNSFSASSLNSRNPVINIPFITTEAVNSVIILPPGSEDVLVFQRPNTASVEDNFSMWGVELNTLFNLQSIAHFPFVFLLGSRYIKLSENLKINDTIYTSNTMTANVSDKFITKNNFYGLQFGLRSNYYFQKWSFDMTALLAIGNNYQKLDINGQTKANNAVVQPIGLFAEPTNSGSFSHNQFAVIPELRAKLGYSINQYIRPFIAYNCFYINNVIRPGNQIDRHINLSQNPLLGGTGILSGKYAPVHRFNNNGMWNQGGSIGVEFIF